VHGASLAFHLSRRGLKPLVLEKRFLAAEASGYSSGLVRMHYDLELASRLAWDSFQYFRSWSEMVGGDCGFTRTGFIQLVPAEQIEHLRQNVEMQQGLGIPTLLVTAGDVRRLAPSFNVNDFEIAAYEPESGHADPTSTTRTLMDAARSGGASLIQDCSVTGIRIHGSRVVGVDTSQDPIDTPFVIDAAGAWAARVARLVGLDIPVNTWRHETMFVRWPSDTKPSHPTVIDDINDMYFRPETGRLTLVGLEDGNTRGESPDDNLGKARPGFVERAVERICRRIPALENGSLHTTQAGFDGVTPDSQPILGPAGPDGFYLDCGFSGTGFKIAPAVGANLAAWILDGQPAEIDISPLSVKRFSSGDLMIGQHTYNKDF
jgi:glycine/D-amino acid oxidase-like deaminating enzyme